MKTRPCLIDSSRQKKVLCTVSAAALMLGAASAATVGLHFQENYCSAYAYSGYIVTLTAFGVPTNQWENLLPMDTGYNACKGPLGYTLNEVIDTTTDTNGLNPLPNGSLDVTWFGPTANYDPFAGYAGTPPNYYHPGGSTAAMNIGTAPDSGEEQIYATFIRDGINFGPPGGPNNDQPGYSIDITGLKSLFTNSPFVVETMASGDSIETLTNVMIIDATGHTTNLISYPNTPPVLNSEGSPYYQGTGGGLSTGSAALNTDHLQIMSVQPVHVVSNYNHAGTISGFILTDKPVVTMSPRSVFAGPGDSVQINPYVLGVPPLSYQWRKGGTAVSGATNSVYSIAKATLSDSGNYDLVVTNLYGAVTTSVATVTVDNLSIASAGTNVVFDSNPLNPQHDGLNDGATWLASSTDSNSKTRDGVMEFTAADTNGITVTATSNFDSPSATITMWMRSAGNSSPTGTFGASLISWTNGGTANDLVILQSDGGQIYFQAPNTTANSFFSTGTVSDDDWHFIALTYDVSSNGGVNLYIDGVLDTTNENAAPWTTPKGPNLEFGFSSDPTFENYNGLLDDIRIYNTQLSAAQISSIYHTDALANTNALQMELNFTAPPGPGLWLNWSAAPSVLQAAPEVNGPWIDWPGASGPYLVVPSASQQFFRYRGYTPQSVQSNPYLM